jgi:hypothetical protein
MKAWKSTSEVSLVRYAENTGFRLDLFAETLKYRYEIRKQLESLVADSKELKRDFSHSTDSRVTVDQRMCNIRR